MSRNGKKLSFIEWLGFKRELNLARHRVLGIALGFFALLLIFVLVIGGISTVVHFLAEVLKADADDSAIRNIGLILVAIFGAPFIFWRATVAQKQADTAEQSHITDQINKAVAGLGADKTTTKIGRPIKIYMGKSDRLVHLVDNPEAFEVQDKSLEIRRYHDVSFVGSNRDEVFEGTHVEVRTWEAERTEIEWQGEKRQLEEGAAVAEEGDWTVFSETLPNIEVRVGAIYALERISQDSLRDHIQIMEILTAYVRENSPGFDLKPSEEPFFPPQPRTDIQTALDVIGRRSRKQIAFEHEGKYRLDMRKVNLSGANFSDGNFEGAIFNGSRLEAATFRNANLVAARLRGCMLNHADFFKAHLRGAILDNVIINRLGGWNGSIILAADMRGISLAGADISAISHLPTDEVHAPTFGTKDTKLHDFVSELHEERRNDIQQFSYHVSGVEVQDVEEVQENLRNSGFLYWSPYVSDDAGTGLLRSALWENLGFIGFPFSDH